MVLLDRLGGCDYSALLFWSEKRGGKGERGGEH